MAYFSFLEDLAISIMTLRFSRKIRMTYSVFLVKLLNAYKIFVSNKSYWEYFLADCIAVGVHVDSLNKDISHVFSPLDNSI